METTDERLPINSNTATNGVKMVFGWVIISRTASTKLHNGLPLFRWWFQPKNLSDGTARPKPNPFLSGHNKGRLTNIVNLLFYNETR